MAEKKFVDGLRVFKPRDNAPEFVKANLVIKKSELEAWLRNQGEEIRIDIMESREGKWYSAVNDYKKADAPDYGEAPPTESVPF